jgi:hypothetical protein
MVMLLTAPTVYAAMPPDYQGTPFDDAAYRAEQTAEMGQPKLPYNAFTTVRTIWDSASPKGSGWVGKETPGATISLDEPDSKGKRVIHYTVFLNNYCYAVFGWQWAGLQEQPVDLRQYDAVSFSIQITGSKRPQELFFGVDEFQPAPVSLRDYDPDFSDGSWHRIIIPVPALKWTGANKSASEVRGFAFKTFVWDPAEYDVKLDGFALERAPKSSTKVPAPAPATPKPQVIPGRLECAFFDCGGEGTAYHDTTPINILSGVLNQQRRHQRPHATSYEWNFRRDEGVDISFTKDWADLNHANFFDVGANQFYIGGTEDGEWCQYTVEVKQAGSYKIIAVYGNVSNGRQIQFSLNHKLACECKVPLVTGSMHKWNKAEVGAITFPEAGHQLLALHYGRGFNLAYFEFEPLTK